jgi:biopolymer transport protein ExbB/TolQ
MEFMDFSTLLANAGADFSLAGMWEQMGIIAKFVMVLLLLMFLLSLALMIERSRAYSRAKRQSISYIMLLRNFLQERKLQEAVTAAGQHGDSPLAKVVGAGMGEYLKGMEALQEEGPEDVGDFDLVDAVNRQLERAKERETANLKRGLTVLATVGSTSVFVGLFGTVVGIITAFQGLSSDGGGGLSSVAGGISEALVATAVGLMVAIPSVVAFNLFNGRVEASRST